jgi:hypothetical protein
VVAKKLEAMVRLGVANSRMKDFYDVVVLADLFDFDGALLARAIEATFVRRSTAIPRALPIAMSDEFAADATKQSQWKGFLRKSSLQHAGSLDETVRRLRGFAWPPMQAAANPALWSTTWPAGGPLGVSPACRTARGMRASRGFSVRARSSWSRSTTRAPARPGSSAALRGRAT